jgi:hypothetical protein
VKVKGETKMQINCGAQYSESIVKDGRYGYPSPVTTMILCTLKDKN